MAKTIMIQGTASNVGKSLIVAGLCRIFKQEGFSVAPFKSQNMALNSFITREGLEIGRAQVVQAEAAGIEPSADMNPILLKPTGEHKSQVIVRGEVYKNMDARDYYTHKTQFIPKIQEAFNRLSSQYDIIVIEGAGSPAEINLKQNDIVNMFIAHLASAPVLLTGDIDRGGVFAHLAGTMQLLDAEDRQLVKGVLINKFRGDKSLLQSGLAQLEAIIERPVLGVIPMMNIDIDDEDSLSERLHSTSNDAALEIAVIHLPQMANFTDFAALSQGSLAAVRYVQKPAGLENASLIIIPGTKNTMASLNWLRQQGFEPVIKQKAAQGTPIFGICGGYQILGQTLADPQNVEHGGTMDGLGLLPLQTIFEEQKQRTRVAGQFLPLQGPLAALSGQKIEAYEIHMGRSTIIAAHPLSAKTSPLVSAINTINSRNTDSGMFCGNVYGCYLHGIFDQTADTLIKTLAAAKGIPITAHSTEKNHTFYKETQYELLAAALRKNINIQAIWTILNKSV